MPDEIFHAVVAGADDLVVRRLREGGDLLELEPALLYLQVSLLSLEPASRPDQLDPPDSSRRPS